MNDWRLKLNEIKDMQGKILKHQDILTRFERLSLDQDLAAKKEAASPIIQAGVLGEFSAALMKYQSAQTYMMTVRKAEVNRWEASTLNAEMASVKNRVELALKKPVDHMGGDPGPSKALQAIYSEAQSSGDRYKQRAAAEVFSSLAADFAHVPDQDERMKVNALTRQAEADIVPLRVTDVMLAADANIQAAKAELLAQGPALAEVHGVIHGGQPINSGLSYGPLAQAYKRVRVDPDTGDVRILEPDDVEVTGIVPERQRKGV